MLSTILIVSELSLWQLTLTAVAGLLVLVRVLGQAVVKPN